MFNILSQITLKLVKVKFLRNEEQHCLLLSLVDDFTGVHSKNALLTHNHILSTLFSGTSGFFSCTPFGTKSNISIHFFSEHIFAVHSKKGLQPGTNSFNALQCLQPWTNNLNSTK